MLAWLGHPAWAAALLALGFLVLLFFRDPPRRYDGDPRLVVAAADGVITQIGTVQDDAVGPGEWQRVVTFLSPLDVHVQRTPVAGEVVVERFTEGRKAPAFKPDADRYNENHLTVVRRESGDLIGIRQIAGAVARRVVCYLRQGERVPQGRLMGVIKFSSRVDLLVPPSYRLLVKVGQRLRNGETPVAAPPG